METVHLEHDNEVIRDLFQEGEPPEPGAITRVKVVIYHPLTREVFHCLNWPSDSETSLVGNRLTLRLGHLGLPSGTLVCRLIVYDALSQGGIKWDEFYLSTKPQVACGE